MQSKNKFLAIATIILLILSIAAATMLLPNTAAHTPSWQIPTYSFMSVSPNPVGVGQTVNVNFWVNIPPPTASAQYGDRWSNLTVYVITPDGTTKSLGTFTSDATGGTFTTYSPPAVGNYTFYMKFGGQTLQGLNTANGLPSTDPSVGDYFQPSESNRFTITVQQEPIPYEPAAPLPTQYWTRPIYGENNAWYTIAGNWLGLGQSTFAATGMYSPDGGNYAPYTTAPNSAHILWSKPEAFGGIIGGEFGGSETGNYYSTSQYEPKFAPIIMNGVLYYTRYPGSSTHPEGWAAVDLRTGKEIWTKTPAEVNNEVLRSGQIINMITPNQFGALAYLWAIPASASGFMAAGSYMSMYDAMTGDWILNVTGTPAMTIVNDEHGDLIGYYVNTTTNYMTGKISASLSMWNSTVCINKNIANYGGGAPVADQWMWRPPKGVQLDFTMGVVWSKPLPANDTDGHSLTIMTTMFGMQFPSYVLSISSVTVKDNVVVLLGSGAAQFFYQTGWQEEAGFSASTGDLLWGPFNVTEVPFSIVYTGGNWAGNGARIELTESTLAVTGYSLKTGQKIWGPTALPNVSPFSSLGANSVEADGVDYIWLYGGDVYAFNITTGQLLWQYHTPSGGYESPYGVEPLWTFTVGTVADGKLFVPEGHMYSPPLFHQAQQLALNITNGQVVWSTDAFDVTSAPAVADGIMTTLNAYDNQIYAWGKGPTKMTVTAPDVGVSTATPITIRGTVTDISAGTQQDAVAANFPNGVPAVSDESMSQFMETVYMQQPMPNNITGVQLTIEVLDSNGNYRSIGTTNSDSNGMFSLTWTPDIPGDYTLFASFAGSQSYYPSSAETAFHATEAAPTATPLEQQIALPPLEMYIIGGVIAIIIAIAIATVVILMKKR